MILPFSTIINKKPTYFVERIWEAILQQGIQINLNEFIETGRKALPEHYKVGTHPPKLHTIREDKKNRWKAGIKIDFFINCRQKNMFRFAPVLPVVSVQKITIRWIGLSKPLGEMRPWVQVDGKSIYTIDQIDSEAMTELALNDGFDSIQKFFEYFSTNYEGKIIHWTEKRY